MWTTITWKSESERAGTEIEWDVDWAICSVKTCHNLVYKSHLGLQLCYEHYGDSVASLHGAH